MKKAKSKARLYVSASLSTESSPEASPGATVELTAGQLHYLTHVMRIGPGDSLLLFNGRDGEWNATVEVISKKGCDLRITEQTRKQTNEPDIWHAFAPIKKSRTDFIVEKATELGVARLFPIFTENTASTRVNNKRLLALSIEAAEQCHRLTVPTIDDAQPLNTLCENWPSSRTLLVLDETGFETGQAEPIFKAVETLKQNSKLPPIGFLTGPEGGFSANELKGLHGLPFVKPVTLGPRLLRAETAAVAALACFHAMIEKL